jgi:hypothetical protein
MLPGDTPVRRWLNIFPEVNVPSLTNVAPELMYATPAVTYCFVQIDRGVDGNSCA